MDDKFHILLVVEGYEEDMFFEIVKSKGVSPCIDLNVKNVGSSSKIGPYFQAYSSNDEINLLLAVYDVDYRQEEDNSPYRKVRKDLKEILGSEFLVGKASLCTNPNMLQIILLGCDVLGNVGLYSGSKTINTPLVHKYWAKIAGVKKNDKGQKTSKDYDASGWQLTIIKNSYIYDEYTYENLLRNAGQLSIDYLSPEHPGSNLLVFLEALKNGDLKFFENLSQTIKKGIEK